ncbi:hypothetical protein SmJEL517_g02695 [Synchytrium microbalum]|uniref:FCP1 homology domain-containing protein n=1 Tax=Synchytrium microbalum TaxID=1806994 RepID=A0A507CB08_9FUNG|nr:uncharacterized protein SmJEL517_g02695 [Synchytrium microbalum]TPX34713.1 hypothetical protein SmJEL517_g02695 [Synchytrium microbalum]
MVIDSSLFLTKPGVKPVLAIDCDDVLLKTVEGLCQFHNEHYATSLVPADFSSYNYWEVWGGNREGATAKVRQWYQLASFANLDPVPGALEALQRLKEFYDLVVVTSRQDFIRAATIANIQKHYPGIFDDEHIHFANHWIHPTDHVHYQGLVSKSKAELCDEASAVLLVDDNLDYAKDVSNHGLYAILFDLEGSYNWNKCPDSELPPKTVRKTSWADIVDILIPISSSNPI